MKAYLPAVAAPAIFSGEEQWRAGSSHGGPSKLRLHTPTTSLKCELGGGHRGNSLKSEVRAAAPCLPDRATTGLAGVTSEKNGVVDYNGAIFTCPHESTVEASWYFHISLDKSGCFGRSCGYIVTVRPLSAATYRTRTLIQFWQHQATL